MFRPVGLACLVVLGGCATGASLARSGNLDGACRHLAGRGFLSRHLDHSDAETFALTARGAQLQVHALSASEVEALTGATLRPDYGKDAVLARLDVENAGASRLQVIGGPRLNPGSYSGAAALVDLPPAPTAWIDEHDEPVPAAVSALEIAGIFTLVTPFLSLVTGHNAMTVEPRHVRIVHPTPEETEAWNAARAKVLSKLDALLYKSLYGCIDAGARACPGYAVLGQSGANAAGAEQLCVTVASRTGPSGDICQLEARACFALPEGPTLAARLESLGPLPLDSPATLDELFESVGP